MTHAPVRKAGLRYNNSQNGLIAEQVYEGAEHAKTQPDHPERTFRSTDQPSGQEYWAFSLAKPSCQQTQRGGRQNARRK